MRTHQGYQWPQNMHILYLKAKLPWPNMKNVNKEIERHGRGGWRKRSRLQERSKEAKVKKIWVGLKTVGERESEWEIVAHRRGKRQRGLGLWSWWWLQRQWGGSKMIPCLYLHWRLQTTHSSCCSLKGCFVYSSSPGYPKRAFLSQCCLLLFKSTMQYCTPHPLQSRSSCIIQLYMAIRQTH